MRPLVSICCITYNHEKYIADAIDSFLAQECDFPFEIIIHDDASTDDTAAIVKKYETNYPNIIKGIYQENNQYSLGVSISRNFIIPLVRGLYIATCEGDDYWCDCHKLKKQVEFLQLYEDYSMCFHAVDLVDTAKNNLGAKLGLKSKTSRDISIVEAASGGIVHISSRLMRRELYIKTKPSWVSNARHGDYASSLFFRAEGKVHFMKEVMSCHRVGVEGSLMTRLSDDYSKENDIDYHQNRIETLRLANNYYRYKFDSDIREVILQSQVWILLLERRLDMSARKSYSEYLRIYGLMRFIKTIFLVVFPKISSVLIKITRRFRKFFYFGRND